MFLVFVDECGYQEDWKSPESLKQQPVHVAAAAAIHSDDIEQVYASIRQMVKSLRLPKTDADSLGRGGEIKAAAVDRGDRFWGNNTEHRDQVRRAYMDHASKVTYFIVCIDKVSHKDKYTWPEDPADLALRFLIERVQGFMNEHKENAVVLIDANKREEARQRGYLAKLLRWGSSGFGVSRLYGTLYEWKLDMRNILEIHFGDSKYSLGLQIADFVARHAYSRRKLGKEDSYPGWEYILPRLYKYPNHVGWGYKEFPERSETQ